MQCSGLFPFEEEAEPTIIPEHGVEEHRLFRRRGFFGIGFDQLQRLSLGQGQAVVLDFTQELRDDGTRAIRPMGKEVSYACS